ncbi:MAG: protein kinase [Planctomycetes bacterium]|nr:protein kinase [Planctomycetota bacterium]
MNSDTMTDATGGSNDERLNELVMTALDALERGDGAAVEELVRAHPAHAAALRRRIALLADIGVLGESSEARPPERLGEFEILEQLGAGGMGVVYRAREPRLGREVALKVVRPERLFFEGTRERFKREVETIARLQHPGIVPVYSVGEEQGVPYFAMELVAGRTVEAILKSLEGREPSSLEGRDLAPERERAGYLFEGSWESTCLRVVEQVAEALDHAHRRGVIHRDLKPSNIMVTAGDASRAMVFDFGLAHATGGGKLTHTGSRLGTLQYMAPEQVRGDANAIDARTDVYGLGVTLYEMLALRPAFGGRSDADVIVAIESGETRTVRAHNPRISWEAETVCATAMEREPSRRYANASDFARDLRNVLEKRPIEARRTGAGLRARRWIERHPALAAAYALAALLVIGGPLLWAWQEREAGVAIRAQRDRAERNYARAMDAVDQMLTQVGEVDLRFVPQMEPVRRSVLESAVRLLEGFVAEEPSDENARLEVAKGHARLARLFEELGRNDEAAGAREKEIAIYSALAAAAPNDLERRKALLSARVGLANALVTTEKVDAAKPLLESNERELDELLAAHPGSLDLEADWVINNVQRGKALWLAGEPESARDVLKRGVERFETVLAAHPRDVDFLEHGYSCWNEYGFLLMEYFSEGTTINREAEQALTRAVELAGALAAAKPEDGHRAREFAVARINLGGISMRAGDFERAIELYGEARDGLRELVARFPNSPGYEFELATAYNQLGLAADYQRLPEIAETNYTRTLELLRKIAQLAPTEPAFQNRLGLVAFNLSATKRELDKLDEAEALTLEAVEAHKHAVELAPGNADFPLDLASAYMAVCAVRRSKGDWRGATEFASSIARAAPQSPLNQWRTAVAYIQCVDLVRADHELDDAERTRIVEDFAVHAVDAMRAAFERSDPRAERDLETLQDPKPLEGTAAWRAFVEERRAVRAEAAR